MKYMMFVVVDPAAAAEAEEHEDVMEIDDWVTQMDSSGRRVAGERLRPISDATSVRVHQGQVLVTDGPFTESKEWIAGFDDPAGAEARLLRRRRVEVDGPAR